MSFAPTAEQQAVIDHRTGTVLVLASVGSGKTTTLARRVAAHLGDGTAPERVLALTFTNRAAEHIRKALAAQVGEEAASRVVVSTFHALCNRILRGFAPQAGLPRGFRILDEDDAMELLSDLGERKAKGAFYTLGAHASAVPAGSATVESWTTGAFSDLAVAPRYCEALLRRGVVDFGGLVLLTRALLTQDAGCHATWSERFDAVLVDEVQDTHMSEYEVLSVLAARAQSLCMVGDLDQTIYGWRGSAPRRLLRAVERDFGPVKSLHLTANFRSTRALLAVADVVAAGISDRESHVVPAPTAAPGERPTLSTFPHERAEAAGIAQRARAARDAGESTREMAVLVRNNFQVQAVAEALQRAGLPATTIEQFRFFRRQEVKDAMALARLVVDRTDEQAARRVVQRLVQGVGRQTYARMLGELPTLGLRVADLLDPQAAAHGDPFWGLDADEVVVLDTETTGVDPETDEVIEIGAQRMRGGQVLPGTADRFSLFVKNTVPLGASERVHGISQAQLDAQGVPPAEAWAAFREFLGSAPIAGHNVAFDRGMIRAGFARHGLSAPMPIVWDSLLLARRLVQGTTSFRLEDLVVFLDIPSRRSHRALDDVLATVTLSERLRQLARPVAAQRRMTFARHAAAVARLRATLDRWASSPLRPGPLIRRITQDALRFKYPNEPHRLEHLATLAQRLDALDDPARSPAQAVADALTRAALSRDVDQLDNTDGVRVVTMHQAKGLEFDRVFVPGLTDGALPGWRALQEGTTEALDEERRVFYVAVTRARKALHLSWSERDHRGREATRSSFLDDLGPHLQEVAP